MLFLLVWLKASISYSAGALSGLTWAQCYRSRIAVVGLQRVKFIWLTSEQVRNFNSLRVYLTAWWYIAAATFCWQYNQSAPNQGWFLKHLTRGAPGATSWKIGVVSCDHAHIFIEFKYYNQCFSKPNSVKRDEKVLINIKNMQNVIISKVENHTW